MNERQKRIKEIIGSSGLYPDKVICKRDGSVEVKRSYFYRFKNTAEKFAEKVRAILELGQVKVSSIESRDEWRSWPTTSYFVCIVR